MTKFPKKSIPETRKNSSPADLRAQAMSLLARREYAVAELRDRLHAKCQGQDGVESEIGDLLAELIAEGSLSDERYVESYVRSCRQRSQGPMKIRAGLRQRQLPGELVDAALEQDPGAWVGVASAWLARHHEGVLAYEDRAKYYRRLLNRGFSHEQAMQALDAHRSA
jgi:regulatory protein